ncbi:MAG: putative peptidoglycan lipid II flippase [Candidatus Tokpelaia sp. JSC161]|nr:MAG: putative peptidoglycan lipid II flippase [Candidatus Tokpelaia sp. JSC161]
MSRIFGFLREMLMATALGTGPVADVFQVAFRFPNTFRRLFAEGALNAAFVPLFSGHLQEDIKSARQFSEEVFSVLFSILLFLTLIMELSMPFLVSYVIAPGFVKDMSKFEATVRLAAIMFPYLPCMSFAAMMGGMLNALRHYFAAAIAPVFLNVILIAVLAYAWLTKLDVWHTGLALAWGVMLAGLIQLFIIWSAVRNVGIRISLVFPRLTVNVRRLCVLAFPAAITGGITQINLLLNTNIASEEAGAISSLVYADRLYQLPLAVVGITVGTVLLPELSRALRSGNRTESHDIQNRSFEFSLLLSLPASIALLVMSNPMVRILLEHGQFNAQSTLKVSSLLALYGLGLPAFVLIKTLIPGFFAREDTTTPMIFAMISVFVNIALAKTLFPYFSVKGIVIAEISAGWSNAILLFLALVRLGHWKGDILVIKRMLAYLMSAFVMAVALLVCEDRFSYSLSAMASHAIQIASTVFMIFFAVAVYFGMVFLTTRGVRLFFPDI